MPWKQQEHFVNGMIQDQANCLIQAQVEGDTNGFFVAYFEQEGRVIQKTNTFYCWSNRRIGIVQCSIQKHINISNTMLTRQIPFFKENGKQWKRAELQPEVNNKITATNTGVKTTKIATPQPKVNCKTTIAKKEIEKSKALVKKGSKNKYEKRSK